MGKNDVPKEGATESRQVRKLRKELAVSRQVHGLAGDPIMDVVRLDRLRVSITRTIWAGLAIGSAFTTTGVQDFLAGDRQRSDPLWWGCWGVEPALVVLLITVLRWEAEMLTRGIKIASGWVNALKWTLLGSTVVMNVVPALWPRRGSTSAGMVFAHLMVPLIVFMIAEVMPVVQARFAEARARLLRTIDTAATTGAPATSAPSAPASSVVPVIADPERPAPVEPVPSSVSAVQAGPDPVVSAPQPPAPSVDLSGLGLGPLEPRVREAVSELRAEGRPVTAELVASMTRLPLVLAGRVAERVPVNGHRHA